MISFRDPKNPSGIIWIASYPKSGNTWVRVFLHNLMQIQDGTPLADDDLAQVARAAVSEAALVPLFQEILGKPVSEATVEEIAAARPKVQETVRVKTRGPALLKTHNLFGTAFDIPIINARASVGAIYIVRNPLDIVLSLQDHLGATLPEAILAMESDNFASLTEPRQVYELWGSWSQNVETWSQQPADRVLVVRYEDMLENPVPTFLGIARHIRQAPSKADLALAVERASFKRLNAQEQQVGFSEKAPRGTAFFRVGRSGQWHDKLTEDQIKRIVARHHKQMQRHGYLTEDLMRFVPVDATAGSAVPH
ncbi:MAG: sulfotransferase domain-containing protein [Bauldia sp.]